MYIIFLYLYLKYLCARFYILGIIYRANIFFSRYIQVAATAAKLQTYRERQEAEEREFRRKREEEERRKQETLEAMNAADRARRGMRVVLIILFVCFLFTCGACVLLCLWLLLQACVWTCASKQETLEAMNAADRARRAFVYITGRTCGAFLLT